MKKIFVMAVIAAGSLLMTACGMGTSTIGSGSTPSGSVAGSALGSTASMLSQSGNIGGLASAGLSILNKLMGGSTVNANTIQGTWAYQQSHVSFESDNVLAKIGGEMMGNKVSSMLDSQLSKVGLKAGVSKFTFDGAGNMTVTLGTRTTKGTYKLEGDKLTMTGTFGMTSMSCTVAINGNQMHMLYDANSLFNIITKMGSSSSAISSLLGNYNGLKLGWSCVKE